MKAVILALATLAFAGAASAHCASHKPAPQEASAPVVKPEPTS